MSLNLLVSIIIYALMAFFSWMWILPYCQSIKISERLCINRENELKPMPRLLLIYRSILTERLASKTNYFSLIN